MMMVGAEEGSPAVEYCREECGDDFDAIDLEDLFRSLEEPSNPPQDNILDGFPSLDTRTGVQTSEDMWVNGMPNCGAVSPMRNFEASESRRPLSDDFMESATCSYNPSCEVLEPPSQFRQGNGHFNIHETLWAEDMVEPAESRRAFANGLLKPTWSSNFSYREMPDPTFSQINQGNRFSYMNMNGGFHNAFFKNDLKETAFETPSHIDRFDLNNADLVIHNQQPSDGKGANLALFQTPNYVERSSFDSFRDVIHKQDSSDLRMKCERDVFGLEYNFLPARVNESEKPSSTFPNEYHNMQSLVKAEKNIVSTPSTGVVSRASEVVNSAINGCLGQLSTTEGIEWSSSKCLPSISSKKYGIHLKFEKEEELSQSRRSLPSDGMPDDTSVGNSTVVAQVKEVRLPSSISTGSNNILKMDSEAPKFYDSQFSKASYQGAPSRTSEQNNGDDDSDLCILEDMSAPARSNHVAPSERLVSAKQVLTSREPGIQTAATHSRWKPNDERVIFRDALQHLSQPKSEASPPDGVLSVPLLKHQRIALSWMANKETRSACCSGGVLADDQGLGKTVSTIALILKERAPLSKGSKTNGKQSETEMLNLDDDDGLLENGHATEGTEHVVVNKIPLQAKGRPSGGTLIVCPTSVLRQWSDELHNKVTRKADLSVLVYYGSNRTKDPLELAKYDVVVTTYAIVSMEVPKQPVVNENDDLIGSPYKDSSSCGKRKVLETMSDKKSSKSKKSRKGVDNESLEDASGPLAQVGWFRVVLDEAQSIKNHRTQAARACWGLRAKRRWCLSGTPIQNAIDDLYSYFRFLRHEPYAVFRTFCEQLKVPITRNPRSGYKKLQAVLKTIMLRRTKGTFIDGEPIINLPPKTIELKKVEFSKEERDFYCRLEADSRAQFAEYAAAGTVKQNYVNILLMLLRLRQACDHPLLVKGFNSNSRSASSVETAKKLPHEKQRSLLDCLEGSLAICGLCSDPPEDAVVTVCGHVFCNQCISEHISGDDTHCPSKKCKTRLTMSSVFSVATLRNALFDSDKPSTENFGSDSVVAEASEPQMLRSPLDSTKIRAALDLLLSLCVPQDCPARTNSSENIECGDSSNSVEPVGQKAIVFSQWTGMLDLLESCLKSSSIQYRRLDGTMTIAARDKAVKDFNNLPEVSVMIMSLKAASLGLNMVAACNVLLLDLWWNPTTEDQAIDRAHRIGQRRPVSVYRLTVKDTVEDRILALQQKKRRMVASAFGEDGSGGRQSRLTVEDLKYLFRVD